MKLLPTISHFFGFVSQDASLPAKIPVAEYLHEGAGSLDLGNLPDELVGHIVTELAKHEPKDLVGFASASKACQASLTRVPYIRKACDIASDQGASQPLATALREMAPYGRNASQFMLDMPTWYYGTLRDRLRRRRMLAPHPPRDLILANVFGVLDHVVHKRPYLPNSAETDTEKAEA